VVELHPFGREPVNVWCVVDPRSVAADGFGGMVIGHDEDDVGTPEMVFLATAWRCHGCSVMVEYRRLREVTAMVCCSKLTTLNVKGAPRKVKLGSFAFDELVDSRVPSLQ
jgi:hypothetical protein